MLASVYGKRFGDAQNAIVAAARTLQAVLGIDSDLISAVETVQGNSDRLRALARIEATAALMAAAAEGATSLQGSVAQEIVGVGDVVTLGDDSEEMDMIVSLRSVLMVDDLTKTSRAAITAVFGDPFSDDFMKSDEEPEGDEEPEA